MHAEGNYERLRARRGTKGRSAQEELLAMLTTGSGEARPVTPPVLVKPAQPA